MKKNLILYIAIGIIGIVIGAMLIGFGVSILKNEDGALAGKKLKVTAKDWSGWSESYESTPKVYENDIELNKVITINDSYDFAFEIVEVSDNYIKIKTNQAMSDNETGINLNSTKTEFTIEKGKTIKLTTLTMDAGGIYSIEIDD